MHNLEPKPRYWTVPRASLDIAIRVKCFWCTSLSKTSPKKRPQSPPKEMFSKKAKPAAPAPTPASAPKGGYDESAASKLFVSLADPEDPERISMEGICKLCEQLSIDPASDVRVLMLMWKLGAISKPGSISREEFLKGMKAFNKSDVNGLISILPSIDPGFLEASEFRDFYRFVFQFSREGTHKTIEKDMIVGLLPIVLDKNRAPHLEQFLQFLQHCAHQRITLDQWDSFLQFNHKIKPDLSNHEDDGAWPLLLDEYVEWRKKPK